MENETDYDCYPVEILESKYDQISPEVVAQKQQHLTPSQQRILLRYLPNF
jgi:hypothetical protein